MHHAHAELAECTEKRQLLAGHLASAEPRDRLASKLFLDGLEAVHHLEDGILPARFDQFSATPDKGRRGATRTIERTQGFPPLGACHAQVHRILDRRAQADGGAVLEVHVEAAARRTKAAHHRRDLVWREGSGQKPQSELARFEQKVTSERAVSLNEQLAQLQELHFSPPGIRDAGAARKKR